MIFWYEIYDDYETRNYDDDSIVFIPLTQFLLVSQMYH